MNGQQFAATCVAVLIAVAAGVAGQKPDSKAPDSKAPDASRPKLTLKGRPDIGIAPMRVIFTAELQGGADDNEEFYCPTTVWDFGDSASETTSDCPPYEAGKSIIKRVYIADHTFKRSGRRRVYFSLRHGGKEVAVANAMITTQPGGTDNRQ